MNPGSLDIVAIGDAIVDVIATAEDSFLDTHGLTKGSMRLIDAEEAERLYSPMGPAREVSGGSAGNTAAGVAAFGGRAGFIGQVAPDQLGQFYIHDLRSTGVEFTTPPADFGVPTARSMVLVTPDGHRTMNTFLGAAQLLLLPGETYVEYQLAAQRERPESFVCVAGYGEAAVGYVRSRGAVYLGWRDSCDGCTTAPSKWGLASDATCSNGVDNTPGLGLICEITIDNTITPTGGSAVVTGSRTVRLPFRLPGTGPVRVAAVARSRAPVLR